MLVNWLDSLRSTPLASRKVDPNHQRSIHLRQGTHSFPAHKTGPDQNGQMEWYFPVVWIFQDFILGNFRSIHFATQKIQNFLVDWKAPNINKNL